jgi:hypothetical protein
MHVPPRSTTCTSRAQRGRADTTRQNEAPKGGPSTRVGRGGMPTQVSGLLDTGPRPPAQRASPSLTHSQGRGGRGWDWEKSSSLPTAACRFKKPKGPPHTPAAARRRRQHSGEPPSRRLRRAPQGLRACRRLRAHQNPSRRPPCRRPLALASPLQDATHASTSSTRRRCRRLACLSAVQAKLGESPLLDPSSRASLLRPAASVSSRRRPRSRHHRHSPQLCTLLLHLLLLCCRNLSRARTHTAPRGGAARARARARWRGAAAAPRCRLTPRRGKLKPRHGRVLKESHGHLHGCRALASLKRAPQGPPTARWHPRLPRLAKHKALRPHAP